MPHSNVSVSAPVFPQFRPLRLEDQEIFQKFLWEYQPETSELTFTNLFIWQPHYGFEWSLDGDCLLVMARSGSGPAWALPPIGPPPRLEGCRKILAWLREEKGEETAIERADPRLAAELAGAGEFVVEPVRDHFDYVYRTDDLIRLGGGKYHAKRNHINSFTRDYPYRYESLREEHLPQCVELEEKWCRQKRCVEDPDLMGEWEAIRVALTNFRDLKLEGGIILVGDQVEAFTCGEKLNQDTAVIHIEKANPEMAGLYALINQQFCLHAWAQVPFVNREQDLGEPGLRMAKLSYHPDRLVEKFRIRLI